MLDDQDVIDLNNPLNSSRLIHGHVQSAVPLVQVTSLNKSVVLHVNKDHDTSNSSN